MNFVKHLCCNTLGIVSYLCKNINIITAALLDKKSNKYWNDKNVKSLSLFLLLFVSFFNSIFAQNVDEPQQAQIYVSEGAFLYSADPGFIKQVTDKTVTLNKSEVNLTISADKTKLTVNGVQPSKVIIEKDLHKERSAKTKSDKKLLAKIKSDLKKRKIINDRFNNIPSDEHLNTDRNVNTSFVQQTSSYNFLKYNEKTNISLEFVYNQKYTLYKNVCFTYHFTPFHSVRPPPAYAFSC
ncbi:hypothetical protein [Chryseobacterium echinoideorum]|uniref:hypothetical protein n=1 Tax=Chryseobacterium echinoideorum TaxID=1549648 RepID=UPI0011869CC3|nr:hypothetical protein [Chryseobacterium echinoideorum]